MNLALRENEVFEKVLEGKSNIEIAEYLFVSVNTVKTHIKKEKCYKQNSINQ